MFEYDPKKSQSNLEKHGLDFEDAKFLWQDPDLIEISAKTLDEQRSIVIGRIKKKHWSAVITYRGNSIRIISVRRSRASEVALYES
tara:strand:+ start:855 stop:1112 length:258 start_codon:yes stop_codon:yes gene_type:complete